MKNSKQILWGLVLVIVGILLGANTLGLINFNVFFPGWWTLIIIIPTFIGLLTDNDKIGNLVGLLIGLTFLLASNGLLDFELIGKLLLPVILILVGLSLIFKDTFNRKVSQNIKKLNNEMKKESICATFSTQKVIITDDIKSSDVDAIFGSVDLDLTNAKLKSDQVINASSIFGGINIYVPKDVKVKVKSTSIFGGVTNKIKNNNEIKNTLYINAICLFGGVDIK